MPRGTIDSVGDLGSEIVGKVRGFLEVRSQLGFGFSGSLSVVFRSWVRFVFLGGVIVVYRSWLVV